MLGWMSQTQGRSVRLLRCCTGARSTGQELHLAAPCYSFLFFIIFLQHIGKHCIYMESCIHYSCWELVGMWWSVQEWVMRVFLFYGLQTGLSIVGWFSPEVRHVEMNDSEVCLRSSPRVIIHEMFDGFKTAGKKKNTKRSSRTMRTPE